ncbi:MAG: hypothetical protein AcusKO_22320 [Acuticoccus sp.]
MAEPQRACHVLYVSPDPGAVAAARAALAEGEVPMALEAAADVGAVGARLGAGAFDAVLLPLGAGDGALDTLRALRAARADLALFALAEGCSARRKAEVLAAGVDDLFAPADLDNPMLPRCIGHVVAGRRAMVERGAERDVARLLDADPDATLVVDREGVVRYVNPAAQALLAHGADDLVGERIGFSVAGSSTDVEILGKDMPRIGQMRVADIEWQGAPATLASIRDVTHDRQLAEQLREAQKMEVVGLMAGGLAHDFNNLLVVVMGNVEFLLAACDADDPRRAMAERIGGAAERGRQLTRQLLLFARRQKASPVRLDPNRAVFKLFDMLRRSFPTDVVLDVTPEDAPWDVFIDQGEFDQVILNLAFNARQALPGGGRIEITIANRRLDAPVARTVAGDYVAIGVRDDGAGIAPENRARIFEPFFTTKADGTGTGLGLTICQRIAQRAGGDLVVDSAPGEGSVFTLYLPRNVQEDAEATAEPVAPAQGRNERLLFVEDDHDVAQSLHHALAEAGFRVVHAGDGRQAQELVGEADEPFDIVVCDVVMPQMSGTELSAWLTTAWPDTRLLLMTGYSDEIDARASAEGRAVIYKPFRPSELVAAICALLDER